MTAKLSTWRDQEVPIFPAARGTPGYIAVKIN
jgi:hypothetical protein